MYDDEISLIREGVILDFKSDSPVTLSQKKKTKCSLYVRKGELIFLHTNNRRGLIRKLLNLGLLLLLAGSYLFSDQLDLDDNHLKLFIYGGFAVYAILPRLFKQRAKEVTPESLEALDFEGQVTRVYWRELLSVIPPTRMKTAFLKPAELDQGYQRLMVNIDEESFRTAVGIASGEFVDAQDDIEE